MDETVLIIRDASGRETGRFKVELFYDKAREAIAARFLDGEWLSGATAEVSGSRIASLIDEARKGDTRRIPEGGR